MVIAILHAQLNFLEKIVITLVLIEINKIVLYVWMQVLKNVTNVVKIPI